jgi:hypothetical protein
VKFPGNSHRPLLIQVQERCLQSTASDRFEGQSRRGFVSDKVRDWWRQWPRIAGRRLGYQTGMVGAPVREILPRVEFYPDVEGEDHL